MPDTSNCNPVDSSSGISHVTDLHPSKALLPTVTFLSVLLITKSSLIQLRNALSPIFVTLDGIVKSAKLGREIEIEIPEV